MGDDTKGILSLIFGIIGLCCFGIIFGILAIILGVMGRNDDEKYATAGLILGIIDVICAIIGMLLLAAMMAQYGYPGYGF